MAKGGHSQKSNGSRFSKPYDVSNSFVTKVASKVSDYLGGWFGSSKKSDMLKTSSVGAQFDGSNRRPFEIYEVKRPSDLSQALLHGDDADTACLPAKRFKLLQSEKSDTNFPISPIPSTSGLFTSAGVNHTTFELPKSSEGFVTTDPGPSSLPGPSFPHATNTVLQPVSSMVPDVKANGTTDNHSDSSETTSGCSSLVPQSDRLSQSAYISSSRKRNLEEKLKYARQLQQSRTNMFLNRSIPVREMSNIRKKPSFDVTAFNSTSMDKTLLREKLINSPFYAGQTSYGGASAYRTSRSTYSQKSPRICTEKREGINIEVKSSHNGSTESLTNMSHTAKKILEALEQFSTPVNDAKRIPINRLTPLGAKRKRMEEWPESRMRLATPISPLNPNPGPLITGLNVPTVPDLLKLKRLERIQNSTVDARQVAVEKPEYKLPPDIEIPKRTGKIVTKLKDKGKSVQLEKLEKVNLPKVPLPITTLPKFDFQLPFTSQQLPKKNETDKTFKFSDPIFVSINAKEDLTTRKNNFIFSNPLDANDRKNITEEVNKKVPDSLINFISSDTVAKLKRKSINDSNVTGSTSAASTSAISVPAVSAELKTGSVVDLLKKSGSDCKPVNKVSSETWECGSCLIRNLNESKICCGCKAPKVTEEANKTLPNPSNEETQKAKDSKPVSELGFGDKFKPPAGSWSCKECFVTNKESASKCIACETPKPSAAGSPKVIPALETRKPTEAVTGFGDLFKKQANQWECSTCMIRNKDTDLKCVACETPKPGAKPEKSQPKFDLGTTTATTGGFLFGVDKAGVKSAADSSTFKIQSNGPATESAATYSTDSSHFKPISTSVGVFTFGIPSAAAPQENKDQVQIDSKQSTDTSNGRFMVTSTSGSGTRKDESMTETEKPKENKNAEPKSDKNEVSVTDSSKSGSEAFKSFIFGASNKAPINSSLETAKEDIKSKPFEPSKKPSTFFFGGNSNSLDTVSSSTADFTFRPKKSTISQMGASESLFSKPASTFQFKAFGWTDPSSQKSSSTGPNMVLDANEAEVKAPTASSVVSTSVSVTTSAPVVGSASLFNDSSANASFSTTSSTSGLNFMAGNLNSSNASPFSMPVQPSFSSSVFGSQTLSTPASNSNQVSVSSPASAPSLGSAPAFGAMPSSTDKPTVQATSTFGNSTGAFGTVSNLFASTVPATSNSESAKTFGGLGSSSAVPDFRANSSSVFSNSFVQPEQKITNQPFIFGSTQQSTAATTTASATPNVFTFGASKPQFSFGQSSSSNFNFGSNVSATNVFGNFGQPKANESLAGGTASVFGNSTSIFGQSTAPATFGSNAPAFEFGNSAAQQQQTTAPGVFQFGATPAQAQPATAPAGGPFSLSIPQKFDFTGGQTPEFSATPESPSVRKVIKAVRRTKPKRT